MRHPDKIMCSFVRKRFGTGTGGADRLLHVCVCVRACARACLPGRGPQVLMGTWDDRFYTGLNGLELFDQFDRPVPVGPDMIHAAGAGGASSVADLPGCEGAERERERERGGREGGREGGRASLPAGLRGAGSHARKHARACARTHRYT